ncbi:MAG: T9SS type A sorting domain-containing protein [Flavobacteriales bacterium]
MRPNPATTWVAVDHVLTETPDHAVLILADALGRTRASRSLSNQRGQSVLDLQGLEPGVYTVRLLSSGLILDTLKLVVQ